MAEKYNILFHEAVRKDLKKIDRSILNFFEKKLKQIIKNPEIWIELWNKYWLNLTGFRKVYFANKKYRIVYQLQDKEICIYIVSVGKRESMKVYREAYKRK